MPGFDGTGPEGQGPMTGRGAGRCGGGRAVNNSGRVPAGRQGGANAGGMSGRGRGGISGFFGRLFGSRRSSGNRRY